MRRCMCSSVPPEAVERGLDRFCVEAVRIRIPFVFQIGHDGLRFFSREHGKAATRMIVPGHRSVSAWIDECRFADRLFIDPLSSGNLHDLVGKAIREVEHRVGGVQLLLEVGNHIGRKKIPKAPFGEETERVVVGIKNHRIELRPIGDRDERGNRLTRLAAFAASLYKRIARMLRVVKGLPNVLNDSLRILHHSPCMSIETAFAPRGSNPARSILLCTPWRRTTYRAATPESDSRMLDSEIPSSVDIGEQKQLILRLAQ
jgi:hypothetical protein